MNICQFLCPLLSFCLDMMCRRLVTRYHPQLVVVVHLMLLFYSASVSLLPPPPPPPPPLTPIQLFFILLIFPIIDANGAVAFVH